MTIPDDVRDAMRQALDFCVGDYYMTGDRYDHFEAALAWLDAQPDAPFAPRVLESEDDYRVALAYVESLMDAQPGTAEAEALALWGLLVSDYEDHHYPMTPTAPEVMTIPEDVRDIIQTALDHYVDYWGEHDTSLDNRYSNEAYTDAVIVSAWLDAQPAAPEPDWTNAPDWAQWWAVQPSGVAYWFRRRPMTFSDETTSQWVAHRAAAGDLCELRDTETGLQRGIDWRTTLRHRPEEVTL